MVFFSILPPPPISTLFPYTTLFRSQEHPRGDRIEPGEWQRRIALQQGVLGVPRIEINRSEEHTSELQSLRHLVCRLLLEKKKCNHRRSIGCKKCPYSR